MVKNHIDFDLNFARNFFAGNAVCVFSQHLKREKFQ